MDKRIYLCLAHMSGKEQGFIKEAFDTNCVVPLGPNVNAFEEELESFVGEDKKVVVLSAPAGPCVTDDNVACIVAEIKNCMDK